MKKTLLTGLLLASMVGTSFAGTRKPELNKQEKKNYRIELGLNDTTGDLNSNPNCSLNIYFDENSNGEGPYYGGFIGFNPTNNHENNYGVSSNGYPVNSIKQEGQLGLIIGNRTKIEDIDRFDLSGHLTIGIKKYHMGERIQDPNNSFRHYDDNPINQNVFVPSIGVAGKLPLNLVYEFLMGTQDLNNTYLKAGIELDYLKGSKLAPFSDSDFAESLNLGIAYDF